MDFKQAQSAAPFTRSVFPFTDLCFVSLVHPNNSLTGFTAGAASCLSLSQREICKLKFGNSLLEVRAVLSGDFPGPIGRHRAGGITADRENFERRVCIFKDSNGEIWRQVCLWVTVRTDHPPALPTSVPSAFRLLKV